MAVLSEYKEKVRKELQDAIKNAKIDLRDGRSEIHLSGVSSPIKVIIDEDETKVVDSVIATCLQIFEPNDYFVLFTMCKDGIINKPEKALKETVKRLILMERENHDAMEKGYGDAAEEIKNIEEMDSEEICQFIGKKRSQFLKSGYYLSWSKKPQQKKDDTTDVQSVIHEVRELFQLDAVRLAVFEHATLEQALKKIVADPRGNWYGWSGIFSTAMSRIGRHVGHTAESIISKQRLSSQEVFEREVLKALQKQAIAAYKKCNGLRKKIKIVIEDAKTPDEKKEGEKGLEATDTICSKLGSLLGHVIALLEPLDMAS